MDEAAIANAFYYTFSTIAQTLGGAIALLAAFVLYRLATLRAEIAQDSEHISATYSVGGQSPQVAEQIKVLHREGRCAEVLAFRVATPPAPGIYTADLEQARLRANLDRQSNLLRTFTISLILTVGLIGASVVTLVVSPKLLQNLWLSRVTLGIGAVWFVLCLVSYVIVIRHTLR